MQTEMNVRTLSQQEVDQVSGGVGKTLAIVRMLLAAVDVSLAIGATGVAEKQLQTAKDVNNGKIK